MTKTIKINFVMGKDIKTVDAPIGSSVLDIAEQNNIPVHGACGGNGACGSCRVDLKKEEYKNAGKPSEDEEDTLERTSGTNVNSRLACQMKVTEKMNNIHIIVK